MARVWVEGVCWSWQLRYSEVEKTAEDCTCWKLENEDIPFVGSPLSHLGDMACYWAGGYLPKRTKRVGDMESISH